MTGDQALNYLERNYHLIKERMIEQMERSIELGRELIDTELDTGLLTFIIKPIVKTFYDYWSRNDARSGTLRQIKITLDAGKQLLLNGKTEESYNKIIEENFPKYLEADQTSRQCSPSHRNYVRMSQVAKETFKNYLKQVVKFLEIKGEAENYGDLCRITFPLKEVAKENLMKQLEFTDEGIKIVEEDIGILKIPMGRKIIVKALRRGFELTKKEFIEALNDTYNEK
ncbi:MAG: hypothetical protein JSV62_00100 [Promethearchaeota archaeon]|nr:MAG: hypothetical protein JSV62_00100 [Candidatus Lokiarchaeota archaeon]